MDPAGSGRGVHQSRVGVDQRYKYMGLGVDHGAGHHRPCDQTSNVQPVSSVSGVTMLMTCYCVLFKCMKLMLLYCSL